MKPLMRWHRRYALLARRVHAFVDKAGYDRSVAVCGAPISGKERLVKDSDVMCIACYRIINRGAISMAAQLNRIGADLERQAESATRRMESYNAEVEHTNLLLRGSQ